MTHLCWVPRLTTMKRRLRRLPPMRPPSGALRRRLSSPKEASSPSSIKQGRRRERERESGGRRCQRPLSGKKRHLRGNILQKDQHRRQSNMLCFRSRAGPGRASKIGRNRGKEILSTKRKSRLGGRGDSKNKAEREKAGLPVLDLVEEELREVRLNKDPEKAPPEPERQRSTNRGKDFRLGGNLVGGVGNAVIAGRLTGTAVKYQGETDRGA